MNAIFCARREEAAGLRRKLKTGAAKSAFSAGRLWRGRIGSTECMLVLTGMGPSGAQEAVGAVLREFLPRQIVSAGFAGALKAGLHSGDIVVHAALRCGYACLDCDEGLLTKAMSCRREVMGELKQGIGLTVEDVCPDAGAKMRLNEACGADTVDMESYWIGAESWRRGILFISIRSIFDELDDDLTGLSHVVAGSQIVWWKAAGQIAFHPAEARRFYGRSRKASRSLADFLDVFLRAD